MIVKENPISSQYHQVYFTFSIATINNIFDEVIKKHGFSRKDQEKKNKQITKLVMEKIEDEIIENELDKIDQVPVCSRKYRYLTEISRDNPLLIICQFCVLSPDIQLRFPPLVPLELLSVPFIDEVVRDFTENILIQNEEFAEVEIDKATKDSIVTYNLSYVQGDFKLSEINDLTIDLSKEEEESILFINCQKNDIINLDESDNVKVIAKVTKIHKMVVKELTDELVKKLNFLNTKTVSEFTQKIVDIFTFSTNSVALINYLTEFVIKSNEIEFDEYVQNHFLDSDLAPKKKSEKNAYMKEVKKELVKEYILMLINLSYADEEPRFLNNILEEYEFDKILFNSPNRIDSYQEYINKRVFETRVLEYCIDNNIIKLI
ncbi:MAG: hypothetical protein WC006_05785 [Bacilli bacterium]